MLLTFSSFVTEAGSISFKLRNLQGHTRTFLLLPQNFTQLYLTLFERGGWWRRRELNPRPEIVHSWIYMFS